MCAALYLRVSTTETTANQERELRAAAERMGHEVVEVYADNGISGAMGRDKRPAFDRLHRDAARRKFDIVMTWFGRSTRAITAGPRRLPLRAARARDRAVPASAGPRHHDAGRQGDVSDANILVNGNSILVTWDEQGRPWFERGTCGRRVNIDRH
jgi:hypothetical protein